MYRNPGIFGTNLLIILAVIVFAAILGVTIPIMLDGVPSDTSNMAAAAWATSTPTAATVGQAETPAVVAEAGSSSDMAQSIQQEPTERSFAGTPLHTPAPVITATDADQSRGASRVVESAASMAQPSETPSPTARGAAATPTLAPSKTPSPSATATPVQPSPSPSASAGRTTAAVKPVPSPQPPTATPLPPSPGAIVAIPPELVSPQPDARLPGVADFAWKPNTPLFNGMAYEVVVWSPEQDSNQAWGIAPPTQGTKLEVNLDKLFEGGRFREGSLYWTVLIVQKDPYVRLTLPGDGERRYLVYTSSD